MVIFKKRTSDHSAVEVQKLLQILKHDSQFAGPFKYIVKFYAKMDGRPTYIMTIAENRGSSFLYYTNNTTNNSIGYEYFWFIRTIAYKLIPSKPAREFFTDNPPRDYVTLLAIIADELGRTSSELEGRDSTLPVNRILLVTLYNCPGTIEFYQRLTNDARERLKPHLSHNVHLFIMGGSSGGNSPMQGINFFELELVKVHAVQRLNNKK